MTKLKLWKKSNCNKTQNVRNKTQYLKMWQNSNCDKTLELKVWQNSKTQIVTKLKTLNCDKTWKRTNLNLWRNKVFKKSLLVRTFWHLETDEMFSGQHFAVFGKVNTILIRLKCVKFIFFRVCWETDIYFIILNIQNKTLIGKFCINIEALLFYSNIDFKSNRIYPVCLNAIIWFTKAQRCLLEGSQYIRYFNLFVPYVILEGTAPTGALLKRKRRGSTLGQGKKPNYSTLCQVFVEIGAEKSQILNWITVKYNILLTFAGKHYNLQVLLKILVIFVEIPADIFLDHRWTKQ